MYSDLEGILYLKILQTLPVWRDCVFSSYIHIKRLNLTLMIYYSFLSV